MTFSWVGMPGTTELMIIAAIMLLLFGGRLPKVMRGIGASISEFKKGVKESSEAIEEVKKAP